MTNLTEELIEKAKILGRLEAQGAYKEELRQIWSELSNIGGQVTFLVNQIQIIRKEDKE